MIDDDELVFALTIRTELLSEFLTKDGISSGELDPKDTLEILEITGVNNKTGLIDLVARIKEATVH